MKNIDVWKLHQTLSVLQAQQDQLGVAPFTGVFAAAAAYNLAQLESHVQAIKAGVSGPWVDKVNAYVRARLALYAEHAVDPVPSPAGVPDGYAVKDPEKHAQALAELNAQHPDHEEAGRRVAEMETTVLQAESANITLIRVEHAKLPDLTITQAQILRPMVKYPEAELATNS